MTATKPIWHIAGIGALGSMLAASFYEAGHTVQLLLKNKRQLSAYQKTNLTLLVDDQTFSCHPEAINIQQLSQEPIHRLICCVKAHDITPLLVSLKHRLNKQSLILLLHNGIGVVDEIKKQRPDLRIMLGSSTIGAYLEKPFTVRAFLGGNISFGDCIGPFTPQEIKTLGDTLNTTRIPSRWEENIQQKTWEKFAINCSINLLTALWSCKNGALLPHKALLKEITNEITLVLHAHQVHLSGELLYSNVIETIKLTAENYSSTYQDIQHQRHTEMYYLNKQLIQLAAEKNIPTPITADLLNQFYQRFPGEL